MGSLRRKPFQSSYCAKVKAGAEKIEGPRFTQHGAKEEEAARKCRGIAWTDQDVKELIEVSVHNVLTGEAACTLGPIEYAGRDVKLFTRTKS